MGAARSLILILTRRCIQEPEGPRSIERRLPELFLPDLVNIGQPSLIVLNSFYWGKFLHASSCGGLRLICSHPRAACLDLRYFAMYGRHKNVPSLSPDERPLSWDELAFHRMRLAKFVQLFRDAFPGVPIMFRLGTFFFRNRQQAWSGGNSSLCSLLAESLPHRANARYNEE